MEGYSEETGLRVGGDRILTTLIQQDPCYQQTRRPNIPRGWGMGGDEDPSDGKGDQGSRYTNLRLFIKLDSARRDKKRSLKPRGFVNKGTQQSLAKSLRGESLPRLVENAGEM